LIVRAFQIFGGLVIAAFALLCALGSATLIFDPPPRAPILAAAALGTLFVMLSVWILSIGIRLIANRPNHGGLLSPLALRLSGVLFLLLPVGGLFTGYYQARGGVALAQGAVYLLAAERASHLELKLRFTQQAQHPLGPTKDFHRR
jgi:hypothetical protein